MVSLHTPCWASVSFSAHFVFIISSLFSHFSPTNTVLSRQFTMTGPNGVAPFSLNFASENDNKRSPLPDVANSTTTTKKLHLKDKWRRLELRIDDDRNPIPADDAFDQYHIWYCSDWDQVNARAMPITGPSHGNTDHFQWRQLWTISPAPLLPATAEWIRFEIFWKQLMLMSATRGHSFGVKYYRALYEKPELDKGPHALPPLNVLIARKDGTKAYSICLWALNSPAGKVYNALKQTYKPLFVETPNSVDYIIYVSRKDFKVEPLD